MRRPRGSSGGTRSAISSAKRRGKLRRTCELSSLYKRRFACGNSPSGIQRRRRPCKRMQSHSFRGLSGDTRSEGRWSTKCSMRGPISYGSTGRRLIFWPRVIFKGELGERGWFIKPRRKKKPGRRKKPEKRKRHKDLDGREHKEPRLHRRCHPLENQIRLRIKRLLEKRRYQPLPQATLRLTCQKAKV